MNAIIRSGQINTTDTTTRIHAIGVFLLGASFAIVLPSSPAFSNQQDKQKETSDSCVECHSNPDFLVQNKKLYDYYQQWKDSIHSQEGIACSDCHGGNPSAIDKDKAHGDGVGEASPNSGIHFKNIPNTCGQCHGDILEGFKTSKHYKHLLAKKQEKQGPTCVTCHGSINVGILNVNSVKASCARCHNEETENHPENPEKAQAVLNHFLSIHRYYRYLIARMDPVKAKAFFSEINIRMEKLTITWHTFDLDEIEKETQELLKLLKAKREEVRTKIPESKE